MDELKTKMINLRPGSKLDKEFFDMYGKHLRDMNMKNPDDVKTLHVFTDTIGLDTRRKDLFFSKVRLVQNKQELDRC